MPSPEETKAKYESYLSFFDVAKDGYKRLASLSAREFLVWVAFSLAAIGVVDNPSLSENLAIWAMLSWAIVSSVYIFSNCLKNAMTERAKAEALKSIDTSP